MLLLKGRSAKRKRFSEKNGTVLRFCKSLQCLDGQTTGGSPASARTLLRYAVQVQVHEQTLASWCQGVRKMEGYFNSLFR